MLDDSGAIIRCAGSTSSRLEPHIDIELGSYLGLLLIHHLCSSSVLFCSCLGYREKGGVPFMWFMCCAGIGQLGFWGEVHQFSQVSPFRGISSLIFISTAPQGDNTLWDCQSLPIKGKSLIWTCLLTAYHLAVIILMPDMINPTFQSVYVSIFRPSSQLSQCLCRLQFAAQLHIWWMIYACFFFQTDL